MLMKKKNIGEGKEGGRGGVEGMFPSRARSIAVILQAMVGFWCAEEGRHGGKEGEKGPKENPVFLG